MSDLISRQAAIDAIGEVKQVNDTWTDEFELGKYKQWKHDHDAIIDLPSAQPERKTGRWEKIGHIENTLLVSRCSACGYQTIDAGCYCTNCGAEMEEGEE